MTLAHDLVIVDYGMGNLLSVSRAFDYWNVKTTISNDPDIILNADRLVLPGVGAFRNAKDTLDEMQLTEAIIRFAMAGRPLLGICLGMQLLLSESEEFGLTKGMGLIPGSVIPIPKKTINGDKLMIPHICWNKLMKGVKCSGWKDSILDGIEEDAEVYFIHSYMAQVVCEQHQLASCEYGGYLVSAVIGKDNVVACQFHPEKSGPIGLAILKNFLTL